MHCGCVYMDPDIRDFTVMILMQRCYCNVFRIPPVQEVDPKVTVAEAERQALVAATLLVFEKGQPYVSCAWERTLSSHLQARRPVKAL